LVTYTLLTLALHSRLRFASFNRIGDYSYGHYLYAFPIQQALAYAQPGIAPSTLFAESFALTLAAAVCSWHGVERPALDRMAAVSTLELPLIDVFGRGGALKSSWYGDCLPSRDFPMLVDLYLQGRLDLDAFVSEEIGLGDVEEA